MYLWCWSRCWYNRAGTSRWMQSLMAAAESPPAAKRMKEDADISTDRAKPSREKARKHLLLLSYSGKGYLGMQRNVGCRTIEGELFPALSEVGAIKKDCDLGQIKFQRCSRTDKGVSAARQVVSLKMIPVTGLIEKMNMILPDQIRIVAIKRVTRGFDCKTQCTSRVYEYLLPTYAFAEFEETKLDYRINATVVSKIQELLHMYVGTHNYHNFTSGKAFKDPSAKRYIMSFTVGEPFVVQDVEFITLQVEGQGFMIHQIRKMIGLVIAIVRGCIGTGTLQDAFKKEKVDIPRAPGLGLLLDNVKFQYYNTRYGSDGVHEALDWTQYEDTITAFKQRFIYDTIFDIEIRERSMMRWLETLIIHDFHQTEARLREATAETAETAPTVEKEQIPDVATDDTKIQTFSQ